VTHSRPTIRELLDSRSLAPRRDLGQNFVADPNTVRRIAELAHVGDGDRVVEIGAGLGSLTLALADTGADIVAIEVDRGVVPILRDVVADRANVRVVEADAMRLDWTDLLADHDDWTLVANLPYNVATPLICDLLDDVPAISTMLVMVQREAAERFAASPRTPAYGAVSVKTAYWATARIVGHVPASVFVPRPNVESALVAITRRQPPATDPSMLFTLVRTGFGQRRKMLRRSLAGIVAPATYDAAGIEPTARPEELDIDAWCRLTDAHLADGAHQSGAGMTDGDSDHHPRPRAPPRARSAGVSATAPPTSRQTPGGAITLRAHAKLTLGLRITGVRDDGYHLIDAEMVSLDLHDLVTGASRRIGPHRVGSVLGRYPARRDQPRAPRLASRRGRVEHRHPPRQADSARRRPRRWLDRRGHGDALGRHGHDAHRTRARLAPRSRHRVLHGRWPRPGERYR
jgi:16S rRNA (adenine1518-N6/adenine1519-N6)-dimethyltransferase